MAHTHVLHYIAAYTLNGPNGTQQAVCGQFVTAADLAPVGHTPTCWGCALWLHNVGTEPPRTSAEPARVLARITADAPWGAPFSA